MTVRQVARKCSSFIDVARKARNVQGDTLKPTAHKRATRSGASKVRETAGSVPLKRKIPSKKFLGKPDKH